jgi:hypothetical protein
VGWANALSLVAWIGLAVAALGLPVRDWWRRRHWHATKDGRTAPPFFLASFQSRGIYLRD